MAPRLSRSHLSRLRCRRAVGRRSAEKAGVGRRERSCAGRGGAERSGAARQGWAWRGPAQRGRRGAAEGSSGTGAASGAGSASSSTGVRSSRLLRCVRLFCILTFLSLGLVSLLYHLRSPQIQRFCVVGSVDRRWRSKGRAQTSYVPIISMNFHRCSSFFVAK